MLTGNKQPSEVLNFTPGPRAKTKTTAKNRGRKAGIAYSTTQSTQCSYTHTYTHTISPLSLVNKPLKEPDQYYGLEDFIHLITSSSHPIPSAEEIRSFWHNLMGNVVHNNEVHENPKNKNILLTKESAILFWQQRHLLSDGLNFSRLPQGVILKTSSNNKKYLDYDATIESDVPVIAPRIKEPTENNIPSLFRDLSWLNESHMEFSSEQQEAIDALPRPFIHTLTIIKGLQPNEYAWFFKLVKQQQSVNQQPIDIIALAESFQLFLQEIKRTYGFECYALNAHPTEFFKNVTNIPTALGRILYILEQSDEHDRRAIWKSIPYLPLRSYEAQFFIDSGAKFVLPETKSDITHFSKNHQYGTYTEWKNIAPASIKFRSIRGLNTVENQIQNSGSILSERLFEIFTGRQNHVGPSDDVDDQNDYILIDPAFSNNNSWYLDNIRRTAEKKELPKTGSQRKDNTLITNHPDLKNLGETLHDDPNYYVFTDLDVTRKNFYRFLARQPYRFPLAQYQEMDTWVRDSSYSEPYKAKLYAILAGMSTGPANQYFSEKDYQDAWGEFKSSLTTDKIDFLFQARYLPRLDLCLLMTSQTHQKISYASLQTALSIFGSSLYVSMKCCSKNDIQTKVTFLETLTQQALDIRRVLPSSTNPTYTKKKNILSKVVALLGFFHLPADDDLSEIKKSLTGILNLISDTNPTATEHINRIESILSQLIDMDPDLSQQLTVSDFQHLLTDISTADILNQPNYVQEQWSNCFIEGYFDKMPQQFEERFSGAKKVWLPSVQSLMGPYCREDMQEQASCIHSILSIIDGLRQPDRIQSFLTALNECKKTSFTELTTFINYFQSYMDYADELVFFLKTCSATSELKLTKALFYLSHILPQIYTASNLDSERHLLFRYLSNEILSAFPVELDKSTQNQFMTLFTEIIALVQRYPHSGHALISAMQSQISSENFESFVGKMGDFCTLLNELDDDKLVQTLIFHFQKKDDLNQPSWGKLFAILQHLAGNPHKTGYLTILTRILNAEPDSFSCLLQAVENLQNILEKMAQFPSKTQEVLISTIENFYKTPPFPPLLNLLTWLEEDNCSESILTGKHAAFEKNMRNADNRNFDKELALTQFEKFVSTNEPLSLQERQLIVNDMHSQFNTAKTLSREALLNQLNSLSQSNKPEDIRIMIAYLAEFLYRVTQPNGIALNETQYLALYMMRTSGPHVMGALHTAFGKSRIDMLNCALEFLRGQTTDFITSDIELATREYLLYKSFFEALGAKTAVIYQETSPTQYASYKKENIHIYFSDTLNMSFALMKADMAGVAVRAPASKRSLVLGEADKEYQKYNESFNCSGLESLATEDITWIYGHIVQFLMSDYAQEHGASYQAFLCYLRAHEDTARYSYIERLSEQQINTWLNSGNMAIEQRYLEDFMVADEVDVVTTKGPKKVREAHLIIDDTENPYAQYTQGGQQCLHALLQWISDVQQNRASLEGYQRLKKFIADNPKLSACLEKGTLPFLMKNEQNIACSSTPAGLLHAYSEGNTFASTATPGSFITMREFSALYGKANCPMSIFSAPRHEPLKREDLPLYYGTTEEHYYTFILQEIKTMQKKGRPVILFCEDDNEGDAMFSYLTHQGIEQKTMQLIKADASPEEVATHIKNKAVEAGNVTICTKKLARGKDPRPSPEVLQKGGIHVICGFLATNEEYIQMTGRTARHTDPGSCRIILHKAQVEKITSHPTHSSNDYTATEDYLRRQQLVLEKNEQCSRLIVNSAVEYREKYIRHYFQEISTRSQEVFPASSRAHLIEEFIQETDEVWNNLWNDILINDFTQKSSDRFSKIEQKIHAYEAQVQSSWEKLQENHHIDLTSPSIASVFDERKKLIKEALSPISFNTPLKTPVRGKYPDPSDGGKAVLYTYKALGITSNPITWINWFQMKKFALDCSAWWKGDGFLFPNMVAWRKGQISLSEYFTGASNRPASHMLDNGYQEKNLNLLRRKHTEEQPNNSNSVVIQQLGRTNSKAVAPDYTPLPQKDLLEEKESSCPTSAASSFNGSTAHQQHNQKLDEQSQLRI